MSIGRVGAGLLGAALAALTGLGGCGVFSAEDPPATPPGDAADGGADGPVVAEGRGLEVTVPPIVATEGLTTSVEVSVLRKGDLDADVSLEVVGLPAEIETKPIFTIPRGQNAAMVQLAVKPSAKHGPRNNIGIRASCDDVEVFIDVTLAIRGKPGSFDTSFGADGSTGRLMDAAWSSSDAEPRVAVLSDGKIVLAGTSSATGDGNKFFAARVDANGALDKTFAGTGSTRFGTKENRLRGLTIQSDNKMVLCGNGDSQGVVARLSVEGNPDSSFGNLGEVFYKDPSTTSTGFSDCAMAPAGNIGVIGAVLGPTLLFAQLTPSGGFASSWGAPPGLRVSGAGSGMQLVVLPDGRYLGTVGFVGEGLQALAANGRDVDTSFGSTGRVALPSGFTTIFPVRLALRPDGRFILGTTRMVNTSADRFALAQYSASGQLDTSFGTAGVAELFPGTASILREIILQTDGKLLMTGIYRGEGKDGFAVVRIGKDGKLDDSFGDGGVVFSSAMSFFGLALDNMGRIVVALRVPSEFRVVRLWN